MEIYSITIVMMVLFSVVLHHHKNKQQRALQMQGLTNISHLKLLLSLIQNHRGLSSACLNGDLSKKQQLSSVEQQAEREIQHLKLKTIISQNIRWSSFVEHWSRLKKLDSGRDSDTSFKQHTQLVVTLLYILEDEAERSKLDATSLPKLAMIGFVWRELVTTTEAIGQSRAIGMGVATSKVCSSVHKIRLSFLLQNMQKAINDTLPKLPSLEKFTQKHTELLQIAKSKVQCLSITIERELIDVNEITIDQDVYFTLATETINALDNIFDHQMEQINQTI